MRKILSPSEFIPRPWKNGLGTTQDIICWPHGSEDRFAWRISLADLKESGAFSDYSDCDRILVLIEGKDVGIDQQGRLTELGLMTPFAFDGGLKTYARVKCPGRDLNLIMRKDQAKGNISCRSGKTEYQVKSRFLGVFSLSDFQIDGTGVKGGNFFFLENEMNAIVTIEGFGKYLIVEIEA